MNYRKCEICGLRSGRKDCTKRYFMARFPLDEARCKLWVKFTGNEDLAYVPIEKLHGLKFVCGEHFKESDFREKKTQLKKTAIPSLRLCSKPLTDEVLSGFPYRMFQGQYIKQCENPSTSQAPVEISENTISLTEELKGYPKYYLESEIEVVVEVQTSQPNTLGRVCSVHFLPSDYYIPMRYIIMNEKPRNYKKLKEGVVPSLLLNAEERCRQWVKATENEDLVHVPIDKLHYKHFLDDDFKGKNTQLKNYAVPTIQIATLPRSDEILTHFPSHVYNLDKVSTHGKRIIGNGKEIVELEPSRNFGRINVDHNYCKATLSLGTPENIETDSEAPQIAVDESTCESLDAEVPEKPAQVDGEFTWQQPSEAVLCITDTQEDVIENELEGDVEFGERIGPPEERRSLTPEDTSARYQCNACEQDITGCRYVCVQCADWDLCGACEAAGAHLAHYVLRVPQGQNKDEVEAVLQTIRRALAQSIVLLDEEGIKVEGENDEEDPIAVELGDPCSQGPEDSMAAESELDSIAMDDSELYGERPVAEKEKTDPPTQTRKESTKLSLVLESKASGRYKLFNVPSIPKSSSDTQKLLWNTSDTNRVTLPTMCDNTSTSVVTLHDQCVSDMDIETSSASVVPMLGTFVTPSVGTKRRVIEIVPGMTSPERYKVPSVQLNRLTKEEMNLYVKDDNR